MNFSGIYQKNKKYLADILFPFLLFFYPFVTVNQGLDVSDSLYSLTNFRFFPEMEGMWIVSTYVSNVIGYCLTLLPFGKTVLGMNVYTGLIVSLTCLCTYFILKKWMPAWIVFLGEVIAMSYCWIPTGILYNYLTYLFFTMGLLFLYKGLIEEKNKNLVFAGFFLGINVFVRIPNLTQMALILGLWYYLFRDKRSIPEISRKTGLCILGYIIGVCLPLCGILLQYGADGILDMVLGLSSVGNQDSSYTILGMILSTVHAYLRTLKWVLLIFLGISMGGAMFFCLRGRWEGAKKAVYLLGILVLLRFLWGRGMFSFRYYEDYTSMYEWGMIGLYLAWIAAIFLFLSRKSSPEEKLWAVFAAVVLFITPLGSNNYTYQNLNNLFYIAPFTVYTFTKLLRRTWKKGIRKQTAFCWKSMVMVLGAVILVQGIGFHGNFVFRDGMDGSKRTYRTRTPESIQGMKTTKENGEVLEDVLRYLTEREEEKVLLLGDCPGISFLSGKAPAISTAWPDLESESYEKISKEINELEEECIVVIRKKDYTTEQGDLKYRLFMDFIDKKDYQLSYGNETYTVYTAKKEKLR